MDNTLKNAKGQTLSEFLAEYDPSIYPRPAVAADVCVMTFNDEYELEVMLIKRGNHPYIGQWCTPGGFVEPDESVDVAAARELEEETGIVGMKLRQFAVMSEPKRDPRARIMTVAFLSIAKMGCLNPNAGDDAAQAGLFRVKIIRHADEADNVRNYEIHVDGNDLSDCYTLRCVDDGFAPHSITATPSRLAFDQSELLYRALHELSLVDDNVLIDMLAPADKTRAIDTIHKLKAVFDR